MEAQTSESRFSSAATRQRLLTISLNDHLARAGGGVSLGRRMARTHRSTPAEAPSAELAEETAENRDSLRVIMTAPDVPARWPRVAVRRQAEKSARDKLNGRLVRRSPLSDILELAAMRLGVEGKASLYRCLGILAERQAAVLEGLWNEAVARTFAATAAAARTSLGRARGARWAS
ncbi:hypothetical protein OG280_40195 [Streptomyces virginiae]|uniref:hypothetical protein n=1 Tax=Streptomyces virginiae TaxID=1961 RepID=UPI00324E0876